MHPTRPGCSSIQACLRDIRWDRDIQQTRVSPEVSVKACHNRCTRACLGLPDHRSVKAQGQQWAGYHQVREDPDNLDLAEQGPVRTRYRTSILGRRNSCSSSNSSSSSNKCSNKRVSANRPSFLPTRSNFLVVGSVFVIRASNLFLSLLSCRLPRLLHNPVRSIVTVFMWVWTTLFACLVHVGKGLDWDDVSQRSSLLVGELSSARVLSNLPYQVHGLQALK